jgi:OOP family OmpA-OmpF porin
MKRLGSVFSLAQPIVKRRLLLTASLSMAGLPLVAQAGDGPYVGLEGGLNWESPQDLRQHGTVIDRTNFERGWAAGVVGGWSLANGFRPELELDYRRNNLYHDTIGRQNGYDNADSALANLWYDLKAPSGFFSTFHPYLGGGLGAVRSYDQYATLGAFRLSDNYATEFAYQAGAGLGYDVTPHLSLSVDYRHLWSNRGEFHAPAGLPLSPSYPIEQRYLANTAMLSVRYFFGVKTAALAPVASMAPPPPPSEPAPPPEPSPPPPIVAATPPCNPPPGFQVDVNCHIVEQTLIVRAVDFKTNSMMLTEPAQETLDQIAPALEAQPELRVEIQGYTDSTGPDEYNLKLSQRRADAVSEYLRTKGVPDASLTAHGYGKADPIASNATRDGRAQNRRVSFQVRNAPAYLKVEPQAATTESTEAAEQGGTAKSATHP